MSAGGRAGLLVFALVGLRFGLAAQDAAPSADDSGSVWSPASPPWRWEPEFEKPTYQDLGEKGGLPLPLISSTALQGIYPAFPVAGCIRQHPRRGNSSARRCAVHSQVGRAF